MKRLLFFIALIAILELCLFTTLLNAQDTIRTITNNLIVGSILEMDKKAVKVKIIHGENEIIRIVEIADISKIVYRDGASEVFLAAPANNNGVAQGNEQVPNISNSAKAIILENRDFLLSQNILPTNYNYSNAELNKLLVDISINEEKKNKANGAAITCLGIGIGMAVIGGITLLGNKQENVGDFFNGLFSYSTLVFGGIVSASSTIPFTIAANRNKKLEGQIRLARQMSMF